MDDIKTDYNRDAFDILGLLSRVGGVFSSVYVVLTIIGKYINRQMYMVGVIDKMQFYQSDELDTFKLKYNENQQVTDSIGKVEKVT